MWHWGGGNERIISFVRKDDKMMATDTVFTLQGGKSDGWFESSLNWPCLVFSFDKEEPPELWTG